MKIFIAGSTGVLGHRLIRQFQERGHAAIGLVRDDRGEQIVRRLGAESRRGDIFDADSLARAAEGVDIVIHAVTAIPKTDRPKPKDWALNDRLRREGTQALTAAAEKVGARLYLQQSVVWVARPANGTFFNEESPPVHDPEYLSALDGEQIAREAGERAGFIVQILRCGWFYSADSAQTRIMAEALAKRRLPIIGKGDAVWAVIHANDAAAAFVTAAEGGRSGLWHIVDDQPVQVENFILSLANHTGAPKPFHVPTWLARLFAGKQLTDFFTRSTRTSNALFKHDFGWKPFYPNFIDGLDEVRDIWRNEGFLVKAK